MSNYHEILASFYIKPGITNDGAYDENSDTTPAMDIIALVKESPTEDHFILLGKQEATQLITAPSLTSTELM